MVDQILLAQLWANILNTKSVRLDDNFFALGGHSLLVVKLVAQVREKMGFGEELELADVFDNPTLAEFQTRLEALSNQDSGTL